MLLKYKLISGFVSLHSFSFQSISIFGKKELYRKYQEFKLTWDISSEGTWSSL